MLPTELEVKKSKDVVIECSTTLSFEFAKQYLQDYYNKSSYTTQLSSLKDVIRLKGTLSKVHNRTLEWRKYCMRYSQRSITIKQKSASVKNILIRMITGGNRASKSILDNQRITPQIHTRNLRITAESKLSSMAKLQKTKG